MSNYELVEMQPISRTEAQDVIKKKEKDFELTYREDKIKEYLKKGIKLNLKDFNEAKEKIIALEIPRLDDESIIRILDIMPKNGTELRAIVSSSGIVLVDENVTKITNILKSYI